MTRLPPVCILAGGVGSRLGDLVAETPKPLLDVAGEPFLLHQLRLLSRHGATDVVLCVGYLGERIEQVVGAHRFGITIRYSYDGPDLAGTLGAVRRASDLLGERFLVLYGDSYLRVDYAAATAFWESSGRIGLMVVYRNDGQFDSSNADYADGLIRAYDKANPVDTMHWIDYGLGGLSSRALSAVPDSEPDLAELYRELARRGELCGYEAHHRFYEIGRPQSLAEFDEFLRGLR